MEFRNKKGNVIFISKTNDMTQALEQAHKEGVSLEEAYTPEENFPWLNWELKGNR